MKSKEAIRFGSSEERLRRLINERCKAISNKEDIDKRIWDLFGERWAIMFTDLCGFSRKVEKFGIINFLQVIFESEEILIPLIEDYDGLLLKTEGDSLLIIFRNVKKAVECALAMQATLDEYNKHRVDEEKILLCLGIGYGDILRVGEDEVFGAQVNAASKLGEDIAGPEEILVTEAVKLEVEEMYNFEKIDKVPPGAKEAYSLIYKEDIEETCKI